MTSLPDNLFIFFLVFIFGASLASFICVYLERVSVVGRSQCSFCKRYLSFFELVPIFSYLLLRGKCRSCKAQIPSKLFISELLLGLWFVAVVNYYSYIEDLPFFLIEVVLACIFGTVFLLLVLEDFEKREVSTSFLYIFFLLGFLNALLSFSFGSIENTLFTTFASPILFVSPFWLIFLINKNLIGEADPLAFSAVALFFGEQFALSNFLYSVWLGTFFGITYILLKYKRLERNIEIPFFPVIFFSTLLILLFDYHIIKISDILVLNELLP